jgi:hypothetical protein
MPFQYDNRLVADAGRAFGEYLTTFESGGGQVRADLFRTSKAVVAHVSFPTGLDAGSVTDPYVNELRNYATTEGFADRFRLIYS